MRACARKGTLPSLTFMRSVSELKLWLLLAAAPLALPAYAQKAAPTYPSKTIRLIVPYAPGGIVDYVGRIV